MDNSKKEVTLNQMSVKDIRLSVKHILIKYNALFILVALIIVSSIVSQVFLKPRNLFNVLLQQVPYMLISLGVMLTIMTAGIDLSVCGYPHRRCPGLCHRHPQRAPHRQASHGAVYHHVGCYVRGPGFGVYDDRRRSDPAEG